MGTESDSLWAIYGSSNYDNNPDRQRFSDLFAYVSKHSGIKDEREIRFYIDKLINNTTDDDLEDSIRELFILLKLKFSDECPDFAAIDREMNEEFEHQQRAKEKKRRDAKTDVNRSLTALKNKIILELETLERMHDEIKSAYKLRPLKTSDFDSESLPYVKLLIEHRLISKSWWTGDLKNSFDKPTFETIDILKLCEDELTEVRHCVEKYKWALHGELISMGLYGIKDSIKEYVEQTLEIALKEFKNKSKI